MKKTILILSLILIAFIGYSQDYLQSNDTIIKLSGYDLINNNVRYDVITPSDTNGTIKYIPNLWDFVKTEVKIWNAGKTLWVLSNNAIITLLHDGYFQWYEIKEPE